jgi:putative sterol carrier protein
MSDDTSLFLSELAHRGHEPFLAKVSGTVRFELVEGGQVDRWRITIDHGDVVVSPDDGVADCSIRATKDLFDAICRGEENAVAAVLRGALVCTGDVELLFAIQRLFPGPPSGKTTPTAGATRRA